MTASENVRPDVCTRDHSDQFAHPRSRIGRRWELFKYPIHICTPIFISAGSGNIFSTVDIDHEIFSMAIHSISLIQEGQFIITMFYFKKS